MGFWQTTHSAPTPGPPQVRSAARDRMVPVWIAARACSHRRISSGMAWLPCRLSLQVGTEPDATGSGATGAPTREPAGGTYRLHAPCGFRACSMRDSPVLVVALRLTSMIRGRTIRKLRKSAGMTQAEMAALLRMPLLTLTRWEAGSLDLKAKVLHGLLAARAKNKKGRRG